MSVDLKLKKLTAAEISRETHGELQIYNRCGLRKTAELAISTDSRESGEGVIFCAIKGQNVDGNDFIPAAVEAGADCFICQYVPEEAKKSGKPFCAIIVEDTIKAMGDLAAYYRGFSSAKFVAVTGSASARLPQRSLSTP